ncbi:nitroreductase/quinone reductase family protein [Nocardia sp. NPDC056100]|uniref:nitroreductase/quinone reductase family protein n=1 Tax=Nocardia sp. NPDC056100 TaxID=3345712 RepID=UPI0035DF699F
MKDAMIGAAQRVMSTTGFRKIAPSVIPGLDRAVHRLTGGRKMLLTLPQPEVGLILTTVGAKTGLLRRTPLVCLPDRERDTWLLVGSNFGKPGHPAWTANLRGRPDATISWMGRDIAVCATELDGEEHARAWDEVVAFWPPYATYQAGTERRIRLFRLDRRTPHTRPPRIAIVGAGISGLGMAAKLKQAGMDDFVIYEKASEVGGVWRDNTYPGLCCDIPARNYSFSFAPNSEWSRYFSDGPEIQGYLRRVADEQGLRPHLRLGQEVVEGHYSDGGWQLTLAGGETDTVDLLLCATGLLVHPKQPDIPGIEQFTGRTFHSARWEHDAELVGKRIAVVGNGSTGVQLTSSIAPGAAHFLLFQRTPQWVFPKPNKRYSALTKAMHRRSTRLSHIALHGWRTLFDATVGTAAIRPGWQRTVLTWGCKLALLQVRSPQLRRTLTPTDQPMCKRLIVATGFYSAIQQPHVEVISDPIERVTATGVITRDGREHEIDVLVFATGFHAENYMRPMYLVGENGMTLDKAWNQGPRSYRTVAVPGFPNMFMLVGPNSPFANESVIRTAETHADYILRWVRLFAAGQVTEVVPTAEATDAFNDQVTAALPATTFASGCDSWYLDSTGTPVIWPWSARAHRQMLATVNLDEFHTRTKESH